MLRFARVPPTTSFVIICSLLALLIAFSECRRSSSSSSSDSYSSSNRYSSRNRKLRIGGRLASEDEATWHVAIINNRHLTCGGTLIDYNIVLTSAECIKDLDPAVFLVRAGSKSFKHGGELRKVRETIHHPEYDAVTRAYNAGIMHLMRPFNQTDDNISIIELADEKAELPHSIFTYGWGVYYNRQDAAASAAAGNRTLTKRLRAMKTRIQSTRTCGQLIADTATLGSVVFCSSDQVKAVEICNDDLGSPGVGLDGIQYGIVSESSACVKDVHSTVFTNVKTIRTWIDETINTLA